MKKICFAILVHDKKNIIKDQIKNIEFFCPNASIVFFRSGTNPNLCNDFNYPVCPTSFPMTWGRTFGWFFLNVMEWLENINFEYDYLINLDSDSLFAKKGFEEFVITEMKKFDYMAPVFSKVEGDEWKPGHTMRRVWHLWQPIFGTDYFYRCFGSQVFSQKFVKEILSFYKLNKMKKLMKKTENEVFALEEMLFATLANSLNIKSKSYPQHVSKWIRSEPQYTKKEIMLAVENKEKCYLLHPVERKMKDPARTYIRSMIKH